MAMSVVIAMVLAGKINNGDDLLLMLRRKDRLRDKIRLWTNYSVKNSLYNEGPFAKVSLSSMLTYTHVCMYPLNSNLARYSVIAFKISHCYELVALFLLLYFYTPKSISGEFRS